MNSWSNFNINLVSIYNKTNQIIYDIHKIQKIQTIHKINKQTQTCANEQKQNNIENLE